MPRVCCGVQALRKKYGEVYNEDDLAADEIAILNYVMMPCGPCTSFCLRDIKDSSGKVIGQKCRLRADVKAENTCPCTCAAHGVCARRLRAIAASAA